MNDSDREFLSRFSLDHVIEYSFEDIDGFNRSYYDEIKPFDNENILDSEDWILEERFLFEE